MFVDKTDSFKLLATATPGPGFSVALMPEIAQIMTYPLIRAKVLLMVSSPDVFEDDNCSRVGSNGSNGFANSSNEKRTNKYPRSLPLLLVSIFKNDGIRGMYRGCSVQLLHTIMKSALMLMIRERITSVCHQLFLKDAA